MIIADPHYSKVVLAFTYRGYQVQIDHDITNGCLTYAAWVDHPWGSAIATPCALTKAIAIRKAKRWVDSRLDG